MSQARPIGRTERTWRWCKRKPALAGLCALAVVFLLTLGLGGPIVAVQQAALRTKADSATDEAERNLEAAEQQQLLAATRAAELVKGRHRLPCTIPFHTMQNSVAEVKLMFDSLKLPIRQRRID